jgi:GNAT superfamily N-acetyltransferase
MHARSIGWLTIRPLRDGDVDTVAALFARLGERSRERRFCGAKRQLSESELQRLAYVDDNSRALVGYVDGDPKPAAIARLVRDGTRAEVAFAVADLYQGRGIGSTLGRELSAVARAAGIRELVATVCGDNPPIVSLLARIGRSFKVSWSGAEREFVVALQP